MNSIYTNNSERIINILEKLGFITNFSRSNDPYIFVNDNEILNSDNSHCIYLSTADEEMIANIKPSPINAIDNYDLFEVIVTQFFQKPNKKWYIVPIHEYNKNEFMSNNVYAYNEKYYLALSRIEIENRIERNITIPTIEEIVSFFNENKKPIQKDWDYEIGIIKKHIKKLWFGKHSIWTRWDCISPMGLAYTIEKSEDLYYCFCNTKNMKVELKTLSEAIAICQKDYENFILKTLMNITEPT